MQAFIFIVHRRDADSQHIKLHWLYIDSCDFYCIFLWSDPVFAFGIFQFTERYHTELCKLQKKCWLFYNKAIMK